MSGRPLASLSLDLDNQWSYMRTHGDPGWESYPSYLDALVPRMLDFLAERGLTITVFVVGQDAALDRNRDALAAIRRAGHEIGNHSFRHEQWFHLYSERETEDELARAEDAIEAATGVRPDGFRGPGYSLTETTLRVLLRRGYRYDASTLPTFIGPLARAYYFMTADLSEEEWRERRRLFGSWRDGLRPVRPYRWHLAEGSLLEVPVTTMPGLKLPFHVSYLLWLAGRWPAGARAYFATALALCRAARVGPSLLLHPLDFLGREDVAELAFFPGMDQPRAFKLEQLDRLLAAFTARFDVRPLGGHVAALDEAPGLPARIPDFEAAP